MDNNPYEQLVSLRRLRVLLERRGITVTKKMTGYLADAGLLGMGYVLNHDDDETARDDRFYSVTTVQRLLRAPIINLGDDLWLTMCGPCEHVLLMRHSTPMESVEVEVSPTRARQTARLLDRGVKVWAAETVGKFVTGSWNVGAVKNNHLLLDPRSRWILIPTWIQSGPGPAFVWWTPQTTRATTAS